MKRKPELIRWLLFGLVLAIMGLAIGPASLLQAAGGLPDRTPPTPTREREKDDGRSAPVGAAIELIAPGYAGAWSVAQWQDINGDWQDVDGWRALLDERGQRRWWVAARDFGTGPFRWVIGDTAAPAAISEPFFLPRFPNETRLVTPN